MTLRLDGQRVTKACFDYAVTLATESGFELRFETSFVVRDASGALTTIEPDAPGHTATHVLELLRRIIDHAHIEKSGTLILTFVDGWELEASPHSHYEAWTLVGPSGQRIVCSPGGEISEWGPSN